MDQARRIAAAIAFVALAGGCVSSARQPPAPVGPAGDPSVKRIANDGAGGLILPDGTRVAIDRAGGFTLPNGAYVQRDRSGALELPNGARCTPDRAGGYICP